MAVGAVVAHSIPDVHASTTASVAHWAFAVIALSAIVGSGVASGVLASQQTRTRWFPIAAGTLLGVACASFLGAVYVSAWDAPLAETLWVATLSAGALVRAIGLLLFIAYATLGPAASATRKSHP